MWTFSHLRGYWCHDDISFPKMYGVPTMKMLVRIKLPWLWHIRPRPQYLIPWCPSIGPMTSYHPSTGRGTSVQLLWIIVSLFLTFSCSTSQTWGFLNHHNCGTEYLPWHFCRIRQGPIGIICVMQWCWLHTSWRPHLGTPHITQEYSVDGSHHGYQ